jgi:hypothetical protein
MQLDRFVVRNGTLYRIDAAGDVYAWVNYPGRSGLGELDGFFKKIGKTVKRAVKKVASIPKKAIKVVTKSKIGRQVLRVGGAVFAPFTGGLSLAAAEAAARYGKARYGQGLSRSQAFKSGAVGAAIGYVGGKGIQYGYQAFTKAAVPAGYAGGGFAPSGYAGPGAVSAVAPTAQVSFIPGVGNVLKTAGGALKTIGGTIASGLKTLTGALPVLQAAGVLGVPSEQAPSGEFYDPGAPAPAPFEGQYATGGGGGGGGPAGGPLPYGQEEAEGEAPGIQNKPLVIGGAAALAGLLFFTIQKPSGRRRTRKGRR